MANDPFIIKNTVETARSFLKSVDFSFKTMPITEWAERSRLLPAGSTERPGLWDGSFAPYTVEIQENLHPDSGIRVTSILKSTQALITTAVENGIGHSIAHGLHNILYIISDMDMAKARSSYSLDALIDFSGLKEKIKPVTKREKQRKTADSVYYKELAGGRRLMTASYNAVGKLKSFSWDLIVMDELDEAPAEIKGQGDPEAIIEARGKTIDNLKVAKLSTPSSLSTSRIYKAFMSGDRREYMIPCPRCGGMQSLEMMKEGREWGLYADWKANKSGGMSFEAGSARCKCRHCGKDFFEEEKPLFMRGERGGGLAFWEPRADALDARDRSYHVSAMMSPMTSWANIMSDWLKTDFGRRTREHKNFVITNEGLPWMAARVYKPWEELKKRAEDYRLGEAPEGALIVTGGVDVHKSRVELQLVGWGCGMESWSFERRAFYGPSADVYGAGWAGLKEYVENWTKTLGAGGEMGVAKVGVDVSYNPNLEKTLENDRLRTETHAAYRFCLENKGLFVPVRGSPGAVASLIRPIKHRAYGIEYYEIDVNALKDEIMENIDLESGGNAMHFSKGYDDEFFRQFLSEMWTELEDGKAGYKKIYERNEALDTWIYAKAAATIIGISRWGIGEWDEWRAALEG
jgi:phage terminase large subunit GpA-like protein